MAYDESYKTIFPIPYPKVERCDDHYVEVEGTLENFAGYIQTWSGFQNFQAIEGNEKAEQAIQEFIYESKKICQGSQKITLRTCYFMLLGYKP